MYVVNVVNVVIGVNVVNVVKDRCIELRGETYQRLSSDVCLVSLNESLCLQSDAIVGPSRNEDGWVRRRVDERVVRAG